MSLNDVLWQNFMICYTKYWLLQIASIVSIFNYIFHSMVIISKCVGKFFYQSHVILPFYKYFYIAIQSRSGRHRCTCRALVFCIYIFQVFYTSYMHMHIILNYDIFLDNIKLNLSIKKSRHLHAFLYPVLSISFLSV